MNLPDARSQATTRIAAMVVLALVYLMVGRLGLMLDAVSGFATLVWPATGIALATLLRLGRWMWPGVALGAFAVNVWAGAPILVALGIAAGNTLEAVLGAWGLRRQGFDTGLARVRDVITLICIAAVASTLVSATIGVISLWLGGVVTTAAFTPTWLAWWLGDAMGALVVAPFLLSARPARVARRFELLAMMLTLAVATLFVFVWLSPDAGMRIKYMLMPLLAWAGVRFGPPGAAIANLGMSAVAVIATALGLGPFAMSVLHQGLFELQSFMAVLALLSLTLAAATAERDHARRLALDAVSARDVFLAIASHELRTPLGTMLLLLETLRRRVSEPAVAERIDRALRQTERLSKLVDALMDVARIDSGALVLDRQVCDLVGVVRDVVDRSAGSASRAGCAVELNIASDGELRGFWDRRRVEQLLENLLSNAYRHAPGHVVRVSVESDGQFASVAVRDAGGGIDADRLDGIFDRFQRAAVREHGGLGLGLYIARWIADAHHGHLRVTSNPTGSVFTVTLPLLDDEKDTQPVLR